MAQSPMFAAIVMRIVSPFGKTLLIAEPSSLRVCVYERTHVRALLTSPVCTNGVLPP